MGVMSANQGGKASQDNASVIKEETKADIPGLNVVGKLQKVMERSKVDCSVNVVHNSVCETKKKEARATSPLDTIAEVACRIGTEVPLNGRRGPNEEFLPENAFGEASLRGCQEGGSESPTSIPTQETTRGFSRRLGERGDDVGHEASVCLHSVLRLLRSYNLGVVPNVPSWSKGVDKGGGSGATKKTKITAGICEEMSAFKKEVMSKLGNIMEEINKVKEDLNCLQTAVECTQDMENGGYSGRDDVVTIRPEDAGKVELVVRGIQNCNDDKDSKKEEDMRFDGNEVRIQVGKRCNDWISSGSEEEGHGGKKMKVTETRRECNSEKSDYDYAENGNKRTRVDGVGWKSGKGKGVKRRRDNWTEEENKVFMGMVLGNQQVEEMTLRRMLARTFSPRRTHEQCANHLRILRAQKKLPPAREDNATKKDKDKERSLS